jgi:hypothetical protein
VHLEASTNPPAQNLIQEFLINMAFTMAYTMVYPNFKKGMKMAFGPLGVKNVPKCRTNFMQEIDQFVDNI